MLTCAIESYNIKSHILHTAQCAHIVSSLHPALESIKNNFRKWN